MRAMRCAPPDPTVLRVRCGTPAQKAGRQKESKEETLKLNSSLVLQVFEPEPHGGVQAPSLCAGLS